MFDLKRFIFLQFAWFIPAIPLTFLLLKTGAGDASGLMSAAICASAVYILNKQTGGGA
jgi:hypothetical protein